MVAVGAVLGLAVAALNLTGMWAALRLLSVHGTPGLPWAPLAAVTAICAALATTASLLPTALALRRRPTELAGTRE